MRWDILLWDIKMAFVREWRLFVWKPEPPKIDPLLIEAARDWSPYAEVMAERFDPVVVNVGTKERPEWACIF